MSEKRKLTAILFADIAGYTAMMQDDEKHALQIIGKFKSVIESITGKFNGRIIQFFGDGCLLSFESSTAGLDCAIAMQKEFMANPIVPVRIGMHMGEVVFRNDNAFGDGVNIASRIESMGVPGSILVSQTINDQVINKSAYELTSLGSFEFVNVRVPMEVFAISNEGFVVPVKSEMQGKFKSDNKRKKQKWLLSVIIILLVLTAVLIWFFGRDDKVNTLSEELRQQPVAVMTFENLTNDKSINDFGLMVKDWISYGLMETEKIPIIVLDEKVSIVSKNAKEKFAGIPAGVGLIINGRFFNQSDEQIATVAEIVDVKTKKVLFTLDPVMSVRDSLMIMLDQLKKQVIKYWGDDINVSQKKPPSYNAYVQYLKGLKIESLDMAKAQSHYNEAIKIDSTYTSPFFAIATLAINNSKQDLLDSIMNILSMKEQEFTSFEKKTFNSLKTRMESISEKK